MQSQVPASGLPFPTAPEVIFTNWREALDASGLSPRMQTVYTLAVGGYLEYCSRNAVSVTKASAQAYMEDVIRRGLAKHPELWKDGLNWFFREGRRHCGSTPVLADHAFTRAALITGGCGGKQFLISLSGLPTAQRIQP